MQKSLLLAGILTGLITAMQFNSGLLANRSSDINEKSDLKFIHQSLQGNQNELNAELKQLREEETKKLHTLSGNLQNELIIAQKEAGFSQVSGSGVILTLTPEKSVAFSIQASYLRDIINLLFSLQVEAVSVNGYRTVFKTPILSVGNNILIKNFHISSPFEIQVIGNSNFVLSALELKDGLSELREKIQEGELTLEVQKADNLQLPGYIY
ncbi:DUF881 domain-containing protein [Candidatus Peregrinibacteria bacterium]|jgi:uncharacterized protein YlxW (UPF0749 family)|nr:DUF881 domain-containing protein [Candidatus Peregrinibacteria bacterium]